MPPDHDTDPDAALLARYAQGDAAAARLLTQRLAPMVFAHAVRVLGQRAEAEDVTQEALLRLWKIAPTWESGQAKVSTWLYRVTANLCTDLVRQRKAVPLEDAPEPPDPTPSVMADLQDRARTQALHEALQTLPVRQRQAVVLRHVEGLGNPEIARIMDITPRAVESLTARGKRALADALAFRKAELGYDDDPSD